VSNPVPSTAADPARALPRITLVTPSFQQADFLKATIESVVDQAYLDLEYFVYDGGSTDGSVEIIKDRSSWIDYWQSQPDGGQAAAINAGWTRATGEILGWLNSDDQLLPGALHRIGELFLDHPEADLIYGRMDLVDPAGRILGTLGEPYRRRTMLFSRNVVPQPAAFVRRAAIDRLGQLDESLGYVMDFELWLRLTADRPPLAVPETLARAVVHGATKTFAGRDAMASERHRIRLRYARGVERLIVHVQPISSALYHRLPPVARRWIDAVRPRRTRADRIEGMDAPESR
jgi:glycosyltransferase involved in cell wall biosynthesis